MTDGRHRRTDLARGLDRMARDLAHAPDRALAAVAADTVEALTDERDRLFILTGDLLGIAERLLETAKGLERAAKGAGEPPKGRNQLGQDAHDVITRAQRLTEARHARTGE